LFNTGRVVPRVEKLEEDVKRLEKQVELLRERLDKSIVDVKIQIDKSIVDVKIQIDRRFNELKRLLNGKNLYLCYSTSAYICLSTVLKVATMANPVL
jgi:hypothetical protein